MGSPGHTRSGLLHICHQGVIDGRSKPFRHDPTPGSAGSTSAAACMGVPLGAHGPTFAAAMLDLVQAAAGRTQRYRLRLMLWLHGAPVLRSPRPGPGLQLNGAVAAGHTTAPATRKTL